MLDRRLLDVSPVLISRGSAVLISRDSAADGAAVSAVVRAAAAGGTCRHAESSPDGIGFGDRVALSPSVAQSQSALALCLRYFVCGLNSAFF